VLAAVFSRYGGYQTPDSFVHGVTPALYLGAVIVAIGAAAALFIPRRRKISAEAPQVERSGRGTRRVSLAAGVVLVSVIVVSAAAAATTAASTQPAAAEPVLVMPAPTGRYPVGTRSIELVDRSRREPGTNGTKPRSFVMQLWYPRAAGKGRREQYMPPKVAAFVAADGGLPASIFTRVKLAAVSDAAPRRRAGGWPVVLFSTGYGVERQLYTGLVQDLASHGYVAAAPALSPSASFAVGLAFSDAIIGDSTTSAASSMPRFMFCSTRTLEFLVPGLCPGTPCLRGSASRGRLSPRLAPPKSRQSLQDSRFPGRAREPGRGSCRSPY
jgi:hypothetical protein